MSNIEIGLIGKKVGMTQMFDDEGNVSVVTVIESGPCYVVQVKTKETDGYTAIQIGYDEVKEKKLNMSELGHLKKNNIPPLRILKEMRLEDNIAKKFSVGQKLSVELFKDIRFIDVTGTSIGKGFQGVVKRHGFHGGPATHGSMSHRAPGSIGGTTPARVLKGRKMAGQMGNVTVTVQNLKIVRIDNERNMLFVKGAVPGSKGNCLFIKKAIKKQ